MSTLPAGSVHAQLLKDHDDLDLLLARLTNAFRTDDWELASATYASFEARLTPHLRAEEELLFPDFEKFEPQETAELRETHRLIRNRVFELGVGVDLHQTRLTAIEELGALLRAHAERENQLLYRWADSGYADSSRFETFFTHGRSPAPPVPS